MGALPADLHIDAALTQFSLEYASQNTDMIGNKVAPELPVTFQSDKYWIHAADSYKLSETARAAGARYGSVTWTKSTDAYNCDGYGLSTPVTVEELKNADPQVDPGKDAARILVDQLMLHYEKRVADLIFSTSEFTQTAALAAADRWDVDTSSPIAKVKFAKGTVRGKIGKEPNTAVMGYEVWEALRLHDEVRNAIYGQNNPKGIPNEDQVAKALGLEQILVGKATYLSAADTFSNVWGKFCSICYIEPGGANSRSIIPVRTFVWTVDAGRYQTSAPVWDRDRKSWIYYCDDYTDEKKVSLYAAYLFSTVIS